MGASSWEYMTEYQDDAEAALQQLRQEVFASGRYGFGRHGTLDLGEARPPIPWKWRVLLVVLHGLAAVHRGMQWAASGFRTAHSVDEALELAGASGTHTIIDIPSCSNHRDIGVASPLGKSDRRRYFGTEHPTRADVAKDRRIWKVSEDLELWSAIYFPLYDENEQPTHWIFVGNSGD